MKIKKALCLVMATVMTASLASVTAFADTPAIGGLMPGANSTEKSDAQKVLEMIPDMEYTAENVRVAVYTMGVSDDMTYAFKEMLKDDSLVFDDMASNVMMDVLAELGVKDMSGLADFIKNYTSSWQVNPISIIDPEDGKLSTTTIVITAGENTPSNSYRVENAVKGRNTYNASSDIKPITISAEGGYTLKSVTISGQNARVVPSGGTEVGSSHVIFFSDLVQDTKDYAEDSNKTPNQSVTLKAEDLKRKASDISSGSAAEGDRIYIPTFTADGGLLGGGTKSGAMTITVETEPKAKGTVTLSGADGVAAEGLYEFNGASYRNRSLLSTAITQYIASDNVKIGDTLSFTYNTSLIKSANVENKIQISDSNNGNYTDGTVFFKVPDSENSGTITLTKQTMSGTISIEKGTGLEDNTVVYTFRGNTYTGIAALEAAINAYIVTVPEGTQVSFSYRGTTINSIEQENLSEGFSGSNPCTFKTISAENGKITINFNKASAGVSFKEADTNGLPKHVTSVNVTVGSETRSFSSLSALNAYLGTFYSNTVVSLTFVLEDGYSVKTITDNAAGTPSGNSLNQYNLQDSADDISVTTEASVPVFTLIPYNTSSADSMDESVKGYTNGKVVVAEVTNVDELSDAALAGANVQLTATLATSTNESAPKSLTTDEYTIDAENSHAGIVFAPKLNPNSIIFDYTYNVNATLRYNNGAGSDTKSTQVTIKGTGEQD